MHSMDSSSVDINDLKAMNIMEKTLPSYSTERYYLLSELEDMCGGPLQFIQEEEMSQPGQSNMYWRINPVAAEMHVIVYVTWNYDNGSDALLQSLMDVLGDSHPTEKLLARRIIVVDILVLEGKEDVFNLAKRDIVAHMLALETIYPNHGTIFGVSNNPTAVPGLEAALEYLTDVCKREVENSTMRVVALRNMDYLGGDPGLEPDAVSGVMQYVLSTVSFPWMEPTASQPRSESEQLPEKRLSRHLDYIINQGVIIVAMVCLAYVVFKFMKYEES